MTQSRKGIALAALLLSAFFGGCLEDPDKACGTGLVYRHKICAPPDFFELIDGPAKDAGDGDGDGDGDVAASDAGSDAAASGSGTGMLGDDCQKDNECAAENPYCAKQPGMPAGYCTIIDCEVANPSAVCPPNWRCFDVAAVAGSGPKACVKPSK